MELLGPPNWRKTVDLIQMDFYDRRLVEEATLQAVFLLPKVDGNFHGIGLKEVVSKMVVVTINLRL